MAEVMNTVLLDYMSYGEMKNLFCAYERTNPKHHLIGYITFTEDSFPKPYTQLERTYIVSSNNKAFQFSMGGYSIYGDCMDGKDPGIRLENYMASEHGGKDGWKVEYCTLTRPVMPVVTENVRSEFFGQLIDVVEDFLAERGVQIANDERPDSSEDDGAAIIYGSDYDALRQSFASLLTNWHLVPPEGYEVAHREVYFAEDTRLIDNKAHIPVPEGEQNPFGAVDWNNEDLVNALEVQSVEPTPENVSKLRAMCSTNAFRSYMIGEGWDYIYKMIEAADFTTQRE